VFSEIKWVSRHNLGLILSFNYSIIDPLSLILFLYHSSSSLIDEKFGVYALHFLPTIFLIFNNTGIQAPIKIYTKINDF